MANYSADDVRDFLVDNRELLNDHLEHYGLPRRSGRYKWGSGKDPYQSIERKSSLKKEISNEKNNELTVQSIQQSKKEKNEITIEVSSDDNNEDKYTIKNVGVFISLIHKVKRKINDPQLINQIKSINIKYILIAIFIFLLIFITLCFKIKRSNIFF